MNKIIEIARSKVGVKESPAGSNKTEFGEWFGLNGAAWCGIFVSWVCFFAGVPLGTIDYRKGFAGCPFALRHFTQTGELILTIGPKTQITAELIAKLQPGDIMIVDWNGDGKPDHTLFFVRNIDGIRFETIEGNTGKTASKDPKAVQVANSNGGEVMNRDDRRYIYGNAIWYVIRPKVYQNLV